jgi:hypothetical protein
MAPSARPSGQGRNSQLSPTGAEVLRIARTSGKHKFNGCGCPASRDRSKAASNGDATFNAIENKPGIERRRSDQDYRPSRRSSWCACRTKCAAWRSNIARCESEVDISCTNRKAVAQAKTDWHRHGSRNRCERSAAPTAVLLISLCNRNRIRAKRCRERGHDDTREDVQLHRSAISAERCCQD